jgi:hypothetical protein
MGDWKLVRGKDRKHRRLIDLPRDVGKEHDLTARHPDRAKALCAGFEVEVK